MEFYAANFVEQPDKYFPVTKFKYLTIGAVGIIATPFTTHLIDHVNLSDAQHCKTFSEQQLFHIHNLEMVELIVYYAQQLQTVITTSNHSNSLKKMSSVKIFTTRNTYMWGWVVCNLLFFPNLLLVLNFSRYIFLHDPFAYYSTCLLKLMSAKDWDLAILTSQDSRNQNCKSPAQQSDLPPPSVNTCLHSNGCIGCDNGCIYTTVTGCDNGCDIVLLSHTIELYLFCIQPCPQYNQTNQRFLSVSLLGNAYLLVLILPSTSPVCGS